jgi:phytoene dehydrogenase-like protein
MNSINDNSIIIIGAGFAGLAAGIYGQMNGYKTRIFELHNQPGGLCTSWKRKDFTIDCCIHWLVGSSPQSRMHDMYEEVGLVQNTDFFDMDEYIHFESSDGRVLTLYTDINRMEKHLLEFSPIDRETILEFTDGIRMCIAFDQPSRHTPFPRRLIKQSRLIFGFLKNGKKMQKWMNITCEDFANRFKDPVLRKAFNEIWMPEFSMMFMLFTFAYLHNKNAGYPIGGSMPMSKELEERYKSLGGVISYKSRVEKIITENDRAFGVGLSDGTEHFCSRVISAADGYTTIFKMLDGKYTDEKIKTSYEKWLLFPPLIFIGIGVNRSFTEVPFSVSGFSYELRNPVVIGDSERDRLWVHLYNHDPSMAPEGKTALTIMLKTDYDYWKKLAEDKTAYYKKKEEIADKIIELLNQRFPGFSSQVEMIDVATPMTFERYTGNWKGSFEGWLITPANASVLMKPMSQTLPGLSNFYMCGQWVEPGGGLPTGIMSGRRLIKSICKEDRKKFIHLNLCNREAKY